MTDAIFGLTLILLFLCALFAVLAWFADHYCERRRQMDLMPPPDARTERPGSITGFYRERDALAKHRRRFVA